RRDLRRADGCDGAHAVHGAGVLLPRRAQDRVAECRGEQARGHVVRGRSAPGGRSLTWRVGGAFVAAGLLACSRADAALEVRGLTEPLLGNVFAYLKLDEEPCNAPDWRITAQYDAAPRDIRAALEAFGYYDPSIEGTLERSPECWRAVFEVDAGEPVRIRSLDVRLEGEAEADPAFSTVLARSPLAAGAPLDHGAYERLKRSWTDLARERGYAEAEFVEARIDVYTAARSADIVL